MVIKTEGIVIKAINYGEGDKILTLYTRTHGKIAVIAKGARKTKSRLNAVTQVFSYGEYVLYLGKQMGTLNQGDSVFYFSDIHLDIEKTAYSAYIVELVDKMTDSNEPNPFLFQQLLSALEQINAGKDLEIVTRIFEMKILLEAGYRPTLHSCTVCGSKEELTSFSIRQGGLICNRHKNETAITLQNGTVKLLRMFEAFDISRVGNIDVKSLTKNQLQFIMREFYDEYVGIPLKTRNFLDQIEKLK